MSNGEIDSYKLFHTNSTETKSRQALQILRKKLAYEVDLSPFIIFNNYVLEEIERQKPKTKEDFLSIKGFGNASWQLFGEDVCRLFH
ncbi:HRDC domain-containing protein [uncultured Vagococcus sp.]|uniref:HRDC domain-containing protein n=1 Tax=uncultured Vagococcus sp. TaxID=189676 RepID=UPI002582D3F9|nr:HRDC domain-containing protein [uncultured Vagococcus sp.]